MFSALPWSAGSQQPADSSAHDIAEEVPGDNFGPFALQAPGVAFTEIAESSTPGHVTRVRRSSMLFQPQAPEMMAVAEQKIAMLQNELQHVVTTAQNREQWWNENVRAMTTTTAAELQNKELLLTTADRQWNIEYVRLERAASESITEAAALRDVVKQQQDDIQSLIKQSTEWVTAAELGSSSSKKTVENLTAENQSLNRKILKLEGENNAYERQVYELQEDIQRAKSHLEHVESEYKNMEDQYNHQMSWYDCDQSSQGAKEKNNVPPQPSAQSWAADPGGSWTEFP